MRPAGASPPAFRRLLPLPLLSPLGAAFKSVVDLFVERYAGHLRCLRLPRAYFFESMTAKVEQRNWAELPTDVLSVIYQKLGATENLLSVQAVCRSWWQLSLEPHIWHSIELCCNVRCFDRDHINKIAQEAIIRSRGHVEHFFAAFIDRRDHIDNDSHTSSVFVDILAHLADRTTGLRRLILIFPKYFTDGRRTEQLVNFVGRYPLLEELHISNVVFSGQDYATLMQSCSKLKRFRFNKSCERLASCWDLSGADREAEGIADNMSQLRELQLICHGMSVKGLGAIVHKCVSLECLDIRGFHFVDDIDVELEQQLHKIKTVRLAFDSKEGEYETGVPGDIFSKQCDWDCCDGLGFDLITYD